MRVQSIQTTNDCRKPCFKAQFVYDTSGYFRQLWGNTIKDKALEQKINEFVRMHENHKLEIIGVRDGWSRVNRNSHDEQTVFGTFYKIFNRYTGKFAEYFTGNNTENLYCLLNSIENDKGIFESDSTTDAYQYLTGQAKPQTEK